MFGISRSEFLTCPIIIYLFIYICTLGILGNDLGQLIKICSKTKYTSKRSEEFVAKVNKGRDSRTNLRIMRNVCPGVQQLAQSMQAGSALSVTVTPEERHPVL